MGIKAIIIGIIIGFFGLSLLAYWHFEYKYVSPTPVPEDYKAIPVSAKINAESFLSRKSNKPMFFHFFNPYCPCSRFNLEHFQGLVRNFEDKVEFYAVIGSADVFERTKTLLRRYQITIPVIVDKEEKLAKKCGVYSTPQAVLLDSQDRLYYRGNYNVARFCTDPKTDFARQALEALLNSAPPPIFGELATQSYGCAYDSSEFSPSFLLKIP